MSGRGEECHQVEGVGISLNGVVGFITSHSMGCDAAALAARRSEMLNESPPLFREAGGFVLAL